MALSQNKTEKITDIYEYLDLREKINNDEIKTKSLDDVINILRTSVSTGDKTIFMVPLPIDEYEYLAILSPCISSIFKDIAILEYTISILTLTQLNFSFRISGEMYVLLD